MISITNASELTYQKLNQAKPLPSRICSIKTPVKCKTFVYDLMFEWLNVYFRHNLKQCECGKMTPTTQTFAKVGNVIKPGTKFFFPYQFVSWKKIDIWFDQKKM